MNRLLAILTLTAAAFVANADDVTDGSVTDGYTYRSGYFWKGTQAYTREKEWWQENVYVSQPYYHYQRQWKWRWSYTRIQMAYPPIPKAPVVPSNWQSDGLKVFALQQEYVAYLEMVKFLRSNALQYSGTPSYQPSGSLSLGAYGISGQTVYARSTVTKADLYGSAAELAVLYAQQQARLTSDAQAYGDKAHDRFSAMSERQQRLMEILAKSEAAVKMIEALSREQPRIQFQQKVTEPVIPKGDKDSPAELKAQRFGALVSAKCGSCHGGGDKIEGGLDLRQWPTFDAKKKDEIRQRLFLGADDKKRMPKAPAAPLTAEEKLEFLLN